jgi:hypothetical protein
MAEKEIALLIMKAAADLRKAAALDRKRRGELQSLADYLESIIYEKELDDGGPPFEEAADASQALSTEDQIKQMMKPFRVRLTR